MTGQARALRFLLLAWFMAACAPPRSHVPSGPPAFALHSIALPGAAVGGVSMDYLAYDRARHRVWVPAGNTASVDVVDVPSERVARIEGFATTDIERHGVKRTVGPSSAAVGVGTVFVGNRGDSSVCALDAESLTVHSCLKLDSTPDGLAYVASTRELWVTTPGDRSITVVDATAPGSLRLKTKIALDGRPEGFAVDDARGVFYTNLEDRDRTLTIDIERRRVIRAWAPECGEDGPKGLALDLDRDFLFVACRDRVMVLDAGQDGKRLSTLEVGDGIDNIDYVERRHELYAAAARAATLTVAGLDARGVLSRLAIVATEPGARNAVATDDGRAYLTDSPAGKLIVVAPGE